MESKLICNFFLKMDISTSKEDFHKALGKRLQQFLSERNLTQTQFAAIVGKGISAVNKVIKGKGGISSELIYSIRDNFEMDWKWLITGEGSEHSILEEPMAVYSRNQEIKELQDEINYLKKDLEHLQAVVIDKEEMITDKNTIIAMLQSKLEE